MSQEKQIEVDTQELTKLKVAELLKQNTGSSLLDSGDCYGRHWEKNQNRNFEDEPVLKAMPDYERTEQGPPFKIKEPEYFEDIDKWLYKVDEILFAINIYHFLVQNLQVTKDSIELESRYYNKYDDEDTPHLQLMEKFIEDYCHENCEPEVLIDNTYNFENALSQDIQFGWFITTGPSSRDNRCFIILQVHQGCDIRGGYTAPAIFELQDWEYFMIGMFDIAAWEIPRKIDYSRSIFPKEELDKLKTREPRLWDSDDSGIHFYEDGSFNDEDETLFSLLYHDAENDQFYLSDTLNTVKFEAKFEMYG